MKPEIRKALEQNTLPFGEMPRELQEAFVIAVFLDGDKELELALDNVAAQRDGLLTTAKAVIARWDTPLWKDAEPTAKHINAMRKVVTKVEASVGATAEKAK